MTGHAASERMTVAAFLDWAAGRPEGERWELVDGEPVPVRGPAPAHAMAAETVTHARIKRRIDHALGAALAGGGHQCEVFVSGPKAQIDAATAFEPDVVVSCGEVPDGLLIPEPLIVVEVLSPSTRDKDFTVKLAATPPWRASPTICWSTPCAASSYTTTARPASRSSAPGSPAAAPCASTRRGWISTSTRSTPEAASDLISRPPCLRVPFSARARCQRPVDVGRQSV